MINWRAVKYFSPYEFPGDTRFVTPELIYDLDNYREMMGNRFFPSPVKGALVRFGEQNKNSMHYANRETGELSKAVDGFPEGNAMSNFLLALTCKKWNGVGVYLDTQYNGKSWPMLHLDKRPIGKGYGKDTILIWIRKKGEYYYPQAMNNGNKFLRKTLKKLDKEWYK